jgi:hypothetical protein
MLSGTKERAGGFSGIRGGDPVGLLCADCWGDTAEDRVVASTCSSETVPASAVAAGLESQYQ